jgi:hypothetical protein
MAHRVLVTGDVVVDHHLYEGKRHTASAVERQGVKVVREHGGAQTLTRLIAATISRASELKEAGAADWTVDCPLTLPAEAEVPCGHHALAVWKPFPSDSTNPASKEAVWRADLLMGYGHDEVLQPPESRPLELSSPPRARPEILVLDDAGFQFRHRRSEKCWLLPAQAKGKPAWIVLKMSGPVCQGDLWHRLTKERERLIVVVSAQELRQESVRLGSGLSWERTVEELHEALHSSPVLQKLASGSRHLIVTLSADGALWLDNAGTHPRATLIFDAGGAEGAWARPIKGEAFGYLSCMVAALVRAIMLDARAPTFSPAIKAGLRGMRDLLALGHGPVSRLASPGPGELPAGFPVQRLAKVIVGGSRDFAETPVPWTKTEWTPFVASAKRPGQERAWQIVEMSQCPFGSGKLPSLLGLAAQTVLHGEAAIWRLPHARFGKLLTADRFEIEALRSIERLMTQYREEKGAKRPLSIGVFGPPGAGKSFGVHQLADSVFGKDAWREFNLSQFRDEGDLIGAFHQVRDAVLGGITPVVFWDEFDSREYRWLQYLLAPMQDGRFQEGQVSHAIGKCIFIFAGATSHTFAEFGPLPAGAPRFDEAAWQAFALKKGPDFHSRLDAYLNVLGPNQRTLPATAKGVRQQRTPDKEDVCAPLRRALLIRALLGVPKQARLEFDADLLMALLGVPEYRHGARSLEKLVQSLKPCGDGLVVRRSDLPAPAQLAMHVDPQEFGRILDENLAFQQDQVIEALAPAIHETWRALSRQERWKMAPHLDKPYAQLAAVDREDNRAAARRIPAILALAGLKLEKAAGRGKPEDPAIRAHLKHHLERLAEAEHEGWMEHRLRNGWRPASARDDTKKQSPALVPYAALSDADQRKDRSAVGHFPEIVARAGYRITWA